MFTSRVVGALLTLVTVLPAEAREFRSSDAYPFAHPTVQGVVQADKLMRERSGGKLGIKPGHDDTESENYVLAQVRSGTLDMARLNLSVLGNLVPSSVVFSLPYLFRSKEHARRTFDGPIGQELLASLESHGLVGLCIYDGGPRSFYSVERPLRTPDDLKGLKVRVQPSDSWAVMVRALGAEPVAVPTERIYRSLQAGALDVVSQSWPAYVLMRHYQVAPYFSLTEHSMAPSVVVFSKLVWDTLSADDKAVIRSAAKDSVPHMRRLWDELTVSGRQVVVQGGGKIVDDVDRKAFSERLVPLYGSVVDSDLLNSVVRRIQADDHAELSKRLH